MIVKHRVRGTYEDFETVKQGIQASLDRKTASVAARNLYLNIDATLATVRLNNDQPIVPIDAQVVFWLTGAELEVAQELRAYAGLPELLVVGTTR